MNEIIYSHNLLISTLSCVLTILFVFLFVREFIQLGKSDTTTKQHDKIARKTILFGILSLLMTVPSILTGWGYVVIR